ncbi:hypothetical protein CASFOL_000132 [Castilleja foliolosa]|uniref:RRM domain-containing protein n=1 Tax=Castilleja foliolosa TaxID=1961234 RepID=A0ABD3ER57_9LAMI
MLTGSDPYNNDARGTPDILHKDMLSSRPDAYGSEYFPGYLSEPGVSGITAGASYRGYETSFDDPNLHGHRRDRLGVSGLTSGASRRGYQSSFEDPSLLGPRRDVGLGIGPGIPDVSFERSNSLRRSSGPPVVEAEAEAELSNVLFVDGLPTDCTRREMGHLFRPFIGFRELRVVHKEPRNRGDKAMVLCFVEFTEAKCALTALEALQGYKFDDKKPDSPLLKIHFAHFPFHLPSERDGPRV